MFIYRQKQKGMVLICAIAILAVLSIMATSFVRMMTLNLQAAKNHLNYVDAKFAAIAGIEVAKAKMWEFMLTRDNTSESTSISFTNNMYGNDAFTNSGTVGRTTDNGKIGRYEYNGNSYQFKIQDNQGKLNLNSHIAYQLKSNNTNNVDMTPDGRKILDIRQGYANRIMNNIILSLAQACGFGDDSSNIANSLRPLDATVPKFSSMYEVESILKNNSTNTEAINNFLNNVCVNSIMDSLCYTADYQNPILISGSNINYYREYRSPINLKTVSQELLTALISNIHATVTISYPVIGYTEDNTQELSISNEPRTYEISFSEKASNIASILITNRATITSMAKLEEAIQNLLRMKKKQNDVYELSNNCPSKDSNVSINDLTWTHICGDILIANFNPNVRENLYNAPHTIAKLVQKSELYQIEEDVKIPSHTTELCLYEMGHVDIISQGEITAQNHNLTVARAQIQESIAFGTTMTLTSFNDFNATSNNTSNSNIAYFPERHSSGSNDNILQNTCGYISGKYNSFSAPATSTRWYNVYDGILAKSSLNTITEDNANCTQNSFSNFPATIYSTSGDLHFWVKLTEDWYEPTMCSLFSASCKSEDTKQYIPYPVHYNETTGKSEEDDYYDGIQMYVYKNSKGELIVSRLFFCGYFDSGGAYDGIESLAVDVSEDKLPDSKRAYARRDIKIDLGGDEAAHWKANEWNLVKIHWNDELAEDGLTATLYSYSQSKITKTTDTNQETISNRKERTYNCVTYGPNSTTSPKFCVLNEKENITGNNSSLDRVQILGMYRDQKSQGDSTSGLKSLFLFNEIASLPGNSTMYDIKMDNNIDELPRKISTEISYSSKFTFRIDNHPNNTLEEDDSKDPNKNPFLNYNLKSITKWGYVSSLNWIAYPEKTKMRFYNNDTISDNNYYYIMNDNDAQPKSNPAYTTMSSLTHSADGSTGTILPFETLTDNNKVSNNGELTCTVTLYNKTNYPTTLDSITAHIIYPTVYASTIIQ